MQSDCLLLCARSGMCNLGYSSALLRYRLPCSSKRRAGQGTPQSRRKRTPPESTEINEDDDEDAIPGTVPPKQPPNMPRFGELCHMSRPLHLLRFILERYRLSNMLMPMQLQCLMTCSHQPAKPQRASLRL